ncbi:putative tyrosine/serine protein phosphatase [Aspergillus undulatus]|uniref:putative tyrosine/serine protein phosphatase n=1 Tax=Aspergillus undulatus TaxID=1810928 RepID=UPI003CCE19C4
MSDERPFDNIINFRDVGRTINKFAGKKLLKEGVLFRSARLDEASNEDIRRLTKDMHITTVIDLRSTTEHQMAIKKYKRAHNIPTTSPDAEPRGEEGYIHLPALEDTGATRHLISLTGKAFERALLWRLDWWNFTKVLAYIAAGYRQDAVRIVGENVMKPAGLTGLAMDTLEASTAEIKSVFDVLSSSSSPGAGNDSDSDSKDGAALIHCTQGKDRTGLIILLSLLLAGVVDGDVIASDYVLSEKDLENEPSEEKEERMREIKALGLNEEYARCPKDFTQRVTGFLGERYGSVRAYLDFVGVEEGTVERVQRRLLA